MHPNGKRSVDINNWQKQKAFLSRGARADTAVRPYAEDLFQYETSSKPSQVPNGIFITSGEIGTNAMYPPGKRSIDINNWQNKWQFQTVTRGPAQRPAPTQRFVSIRVVSKAEPSTNRDFRDIHTHPDTAINPFTAFCFINSVFES